MLYICRKKLYAQEREILDLLVNYLASLFASNSATNSNLIV